MYVGSNKLGLKSPLSFPPTTNFSSRTMEDSYPNACPAYDSDSSSMGTPMPRSRSRSRSNSDSGSGSGSGRVYRSKLVHEAAMRTRYAREVDGRRLGMTTHAKPPLYRVLPCDSGVARVTVCLSAVDGRGEFIDSRRVVLHDDEVIGTLKSTPLCVTVTEHRRMGPVTHSKSYADTKAGVEDMALDLLVLVVPHDVAWHSLELHFLDKLALVDKYLTAGLFAVVLADRRTGESHAGSVGKTAHLFVPFPWTRAVLAEEADCVFKYNSRVQKAMHLFRGPVWTVSMNISYSTSVQ